MDDIISITLLRHGLTNENKKKSYIGWSDVELAKETIEYLEASEIFMPFDQVYSSDLKRCLQTAAYFSKSQNLVKDSRLREMNFGVWEKKTYNELKDDQIYQKWLDDFYRVSPPKGETFCDFKNRVCQAFEHILKNASDSQIKHILIVSHGGPIRLLLSEYMLPAKKWWDWQVDHCSGYTLSWSRKAVLRGEFTCISSQVVPFTVKKNG